MFGSPSDVEEGQINVMTDLSSTIYTVGSYRLAQIFKRPDELEPETGKSVATRQTVP